jgi:hypothetical protein
MRRGEDLMESWQWDREMGLDAEVIAAGRRQIAAALDTLETLLDNPSARTNDLYSAGFRLSMGQGVVGLLPEDRARAEALYRRVFAAGGAGNLGGSYTFKVKPRGTTGISRTIEVLSQQSLDDLHLAIQDAFDWDNDHLYSFYLTTGANRDDYEIACAMAEGDWSGSPFLQIGALGDGPEPAGSANGDEDDEAGGGPLTTADAVIGALGLGLKHKFIYLFDYGDQNEFEIQVVSIQPHAAPGDYPRIVASEGKAPAQYAVWDAEEDEGYEDGDDSDDA